MKHVVLSADGPFSLSLVPDAVADALNAYCMRFTWVLEKDYEGRYCLRRGGIQYCEADFIRWLNDTICEKGQTCVFVETCNGMEIPKAWARYPGFAF